MVKVLIEPGKVGWVEAQNPTSSWDYISRKPREKNGEGID
jgi:hypothetical protein